MIPFQIHRRIPFVRRPFYQRDHARQELDEARAEVQRFAALSHQRDDLLRDLNRQRALYLDLLIKILANVIYDDPSIHPGQSGFDRTRRDAGRDWPSVGHTMVGVSRLTNLKQLTQRTIDEHVPGDYIETGVWRGGCCILIRGILAANAITDRRVYVADSFAGLPPPNAARYPDDAYDKHYLVQELAIPLDQVQANFEKYGLLDDQVIFLPGLFQDTLPSLEAAPFALLRLDGDMYESTIVALNNLYPRLSPGGFIIIDDYGTHEACRKAVVDYRRDARISARVHPIDGSGVWWQKS